MMEETLGKRIAAHRKGLGLTQDALAEQLGVTAQAVSKWENDQSCPDIAMLPKLAAIFGITVDALLGVEKAPEEVLQETIEAPVHTVTEGTPGQKTGIGIALWLLLAGGIMLAAALFPAPLYQPPSWQTLGLTGLTIFGLFGLYPRFSIFRLGCGLFGGYYLYCSLFQPRVQLNEELLLPILLLFFGLGLLVDSIRGKNLPGGHMNMEELSRNYFDYEGNAFACQTCFGEGHRMIQLSQLEGGTAQVTFGELSVDIHDCAAIGENCCIRLKCSFGSLTLYVPRRWRLLCVNKTAFGTVQEYGSADPDAEGTIRLESDVSFGEISIKYI